MAMPDVNSASLFFEPEVVAVRGMETVQKYFDPQNIYFVESFDI
jgi:hypothetical protein